MVIYFFFDPTIQGEKTLNVFCKNLSQWLCGRFVCFKHKAIVSLIGLKLGIPECASVDNHMAD